MKKRKYTVKEQKVVAEILVRLCCMHDEKEVWSLYDELFEEYGLCVDPFTHLPCTPQEYAEYSLEYQRQAMYELYGHCDGLD